MKKIFPYILAIFSLAIIQLFAFAGPQIYQFFSHGAEQGMIRSFFIVGVLFMISFIAYYVSHLTKLPSFVVAIFFGLAAHNLVVPIIEEHTLLGGIVGFGATLILFGGGLETQRKSFKKLFPKIFSLSFPGLMLTAFLFSVAVYYIARMFGAQASMIVAVLLGAVLASTDPAAIIPILKRLRFKNQATKDIIVSESAVTDVTGTLLTAVFLGLLSAGVVYPTISGWYGSIFSFDSALVLFKQLAFGAVFGIAGFVFLELLVKFKLYFERESEADSAFLMFVPVIIFSLALAFGGSGYLAAFVAGLLFNMTEKLHETERFFNHLVDGYFKPTIFILLGALVNPAELLSYAGVGILVALIFMFVIRPITVFLFLGPFAFFGNNRPTLQDLLFVSFVRETGAIPAVLLVTIVSMKLPNLEGLVPIGMWVILMTLIIEPVLTNWVAQKLKVADIMPDAGNIEIGESPIAVLATRGHTFLSRLPLVVDWAQKHSIERIMVLLCLEDKYTPETEKEIKDMAIAKFAELNDELNKKNLPEIDFSLVSHRGLLQDNIRELAEEKSNVTGIFVGRKMLDYRLDEIKKLHVPLCFMD